MATQYLDITKKLDDDSLLHVFSFLRQTDLVALTQTDPRFDSLIFNHVFPRIDIFINPHFVARFPVEENCPMYECLGQYSRSLKIQTQESKKILPFFKDLQKLHLIPPQEEMEQFDWTSIPDGLRKLDLWVRSNKPELGELFRRLDETLTSLTIYGPFQSSDLAELHNIRHLKIRGFPKSTIDLKEFLVNNGDHLESLEIQFFPEDLEGFLNIQRLERNKRLGFQLCPMKRLKSLILDDLSKDLRLPQEDYPALESLRITPDRFNEHLFEDILKFDDLKELQISGIGKDYKRLYQLEKLTSLTIRRAYFPEDSILQIVTNMPNLKVLGMSNDEFTANFNKELGDLVKKQSRKLCLQRYSEPQNKTIFG